MFVLAFIASIAITFVNTLPATFTLNAGGVLNIFLFGLTVLALAWFAPMLASEVVQGQPHLSGSDAIRTGVGATFATAGGVYMAHAVYKAVKGGMMSTSNRLSGGGGRAGGGSRGRGGGSGGAPRAPINYGAMQPKPRSSGAGP